jgi:hypothetical protein
MRRMHALDRALCEGTVAWREDYSTLLSQSEEFRVETGGNVTLKPQAKESVFRKVLENHDSPSYPESIEGTQHDIPVIGSIGQRCH